MGTLVAQNPDLMSTWVADVLVHAPDVIFYGMMRNNPINQMLLAYSYAWMPQNMAAVAAVRENVATSHLASAAANLTSKVLAQNQFGFGAGRSLKRQRGYGHGLHADATTYKRIKVRLCISPSVYLCVTCALVF